MKTIEEIKALYIEQYPHLALISKSHHNFVFVASGLCCPKSVTAQDYMRLVESKHNRSYGSY